MNRFRRVGRSSESVLDFLQSRRKGINPCNRSLIRESNSPDTPLLIPCFDLGLIRGFSVQFREQECDFGGQNLANSLLFSLLAGNLGGERLAPDCALRHAVCTAERLRSPSAQIRDNAYFAIIPKQTGLQRRGLPDSEEITVLTILRKPHVRFGFKRHARIGPSPR